MRVPLRLAQQEEPSGELIDSGGARRIKAGHVVGVLQKVNETCLEHQREVVRRTVCKVGYCFCFCCAMFIDFAVWQIAAQTFIQENDYGLAIAYLTSAEDWRGLGSVVDRVLAKYVTDGKPLFIFEITQDFVKVIHRRSRIIHPVCVGHHFITARSI